MGSPVQETVWPPEQGGRARIAAMRRPSGLTLPFAPPPNKDMRVAGHHSRQQRRSSPPGAQKESGNYSPPHRCEKLSQVRHVPERRIQRRSMGVRPQVSNVPEETIQTSSRLATRPTSHRNYFQRGGGSILA